MKANSPLSPKTKRDSRQPIFLIEVRFEFVRFVVLLESVKQPNHPMESSHAFLFGDAALLMHDVTCSIIIIMRRMLEPIKER